MDREELDRLIARAQDGDVRAFEALLAEHLPKVRRFARAFAATEADADDLAQDALVRVFRSIGLYRYQAAFSTWLYAVVRNVFLDSAKGRAGRMRALEDPLRPADAEREGGSRPDEAALSEEERRRLWAALREVPPEFRTELVLFDVEGHTYDEVAAIEGVAVGTVKSRLHRGRGHLRRVLEAEVAPSGAAAEDAGTPEPAPSSHLARGR